ncbi:hypothetical protein ACNKHL_22615 [Shigella flexneri]
MIEYAGVGVAMDNAIPSVKESGELCSPNRTLKMAWRLLLRSMC